MKLLLSQKEAKRFETFLNVQWNYWMTEHPEWATFVGHPGQDDRWTDYSMKNLERWKKITDCQIAVLNKIRREKLSGDDQLNYDLVAQRLQMQKESHQFDGDFMPVSHLDGFHLEINTVIEVMRGQSKKISNLFSSAWKAFRS